MGTILNEKNTTINSVYDNISYIHMFHIYRMYNNNYIHMFHIYRMYNNKTIAY
jgi:hypothetical protein